MMRSAPALLLPLALSAVFAASAVALRGGPDHSDSTRQPVPVADIDADGFGQAVGGCFAGNARDNTQFPIELGADYVPLSTDDSVGFHVVYSARTLNGTTANNNVGIFVFELDGGEVMLFGAGYGDTGAALFNAQHDAMQMNSLLRDCLGRTPGSTPLRLVSPHWHGDHINERFVHALEGYGWSFIEILFHQDDDYYVRNYYNWSAADRAKFTLIPDGACNEEILSYPSPTGKLWFVARKGHAPGAIDLVIDVRGNTSDRVVVLGSAPGGACPTPPDGTHTVYTSHGNILVIPTAQVIPYGCGVNPSNSLTLLNGSPKAGSHLVLGVDNPSGEVGAGAIPYLWTSLAPDSRVPCGSPLHLPGMSKEGEVLISLLHGDLITPPEIGTPWAGPGNPCPFGVTIPNDASLIGKSYYYQGALIDPFASNGQRVILTDAIELRIGP